ncbi:hypothetical protein [Pelosinus baikalensis]|uniref:Uncharacterized protein n=1 Tax=Pelosinus baikalensis TaxID=2892015 RepID=A0ABS8HMR9_9FIRM|nr:hypothetical protein [Pelosinus baikalensis]MCC5464490.1 hypothetical protein [Pelosinus baikalensis]
MGPCVHCGRLTDDVKNTCSHCQHRKEKKTAVNPEVRSQIDKAVKMAEQYHNEHMTEYFMEEIKRPNRFSRSICTKFVEDEFVAIDMQEVVAMHVPGLADIEWSKPRHQ